MLETWLSKERLLLNSTPRFLTDDEEFTEQPSSVRQCSRFLQELGMARYHNFGFGTIPECNTSVLILNRYHR